MSAAPRIGVVAIGRNEGERLQRCLRSVVAGYPVVYVDSGSTDGSVAFAQGLGVTVEMLATANGFTAARARNAGWRRLLGAHPGLDYIQFVDGDCEIDPDWMPRAQAEMDRDDGLCAVFGRRAERFPAASPYNAICDDEWNVPIGQVQSCGGDVLFRARAIVESDGYNDDIIAGEEPDLCLRLGQMGWRIRRIDAPMTLHDAAITHLRQYWLRARRAGHAYAEHVARHGEAAFADWRKQLRSILIWGAIIPAGIVALLLLALLFWSPWPLIPAALAAALYPLQVWRIGRGKARAGADPHYARRYGFWMMLGKFAEAGGVLRYHWKRLRGGGHRIIEYKGASPERRT